MSVMLLSMKMMEAMMRRVWMGAVRVRVETSVLTQPRPGSDWLRVIT